jgi:hypothetical protein
MESEEDRTMGVPNAADFEGYQRQNYTMVPDQLFDDHLAVLSGAELKVLLYIVRRTLGFRKVSDNISLGQLLDGITTVDGDRLDSGTGLSRSTLVVALRGLVEEKKLICAEHRSSVRHGNESTTYRLNLASDPSTKIELGGSENRTSLVRKSNPQETVRQETVRQETSTSNIRKAIPRETTGKSEKPATLDAVVEDDTVSAPPAESRASVDSSRRTQKRCSPERQRILTFVEDFARELNDEAPLSSSVSRAHNLWRRSGIPIETFSSLLYEARSLTQEHSAGVRKTSQENGTGPWGPQKNKMAYYFAILEQLVEQHTTERGTPPGTAKASQESCTVRSAPEKTAGKADTNSESGELDLEGTAAPGMSPLNQPLSSPSGPSRTGVPPGDGRLHPRGSSTHAVRLYVVNVAKEFGELITNKAELDEVGTIYENSDMTEQGFLETLSAVRSITKGANLKPDQPRLPLFFMLLRQQAGSANSDGPAAGRYDSR